MSIVGQPLSHDTYFYADDIFDNKVASNAAKLAHTPFRYAITSMGGRRQMNTEPPAATKEFSTTSSKNNAATTAEMAKMTR